jgi:selenide, water dikinase
LINNKDFAGCAVRFLRSVTPEIENLLFDPQTSGGLLISLPEADAAALESQEIYRIGRVRERQEKPIEIV